VRWFLLLKERQWRFLSVPKKVFFCFHPPLLTPPRPRARRSDTPDVVRRVKVLLDGHPDLLDGFNCFLPEVRATRTQIITRNQRNSPLLDGGFPCWHLCSFFCVSSTRRGERARTASPSPRCFVKSQGPVFSVSCVLDMRDVRDHAARCITPGRRLTRRTSPPASLASIPPISTRTARPLRHLSTQPYKFDAAKDAEEKANKVGAIQTPAPRPGDEREGGNPSLASLVVCFNLAEPFALFSFVGLTPLCQKLDASAASALVFYSPWTNKTKPVAVLVQIPTLSLLLVSRRF
jgi:hypothetical protein